MKNKFFILSILIISCSYTVLDLKAIDLKWQNLVYSDIYTLQTLPESTTPAVPQSGVIHPWNCTSYQPISPPPITNNDFQNYIHKPYNNPDLAKQSEYSQQSAQNTTQTTQGAANSEYDNNMQQICANFYRDRRIRKFQTFDQQVYHRDIMSFSKFAESCENYEKNNQLIWSGLNSQPDQSLDDNSETNSNSNSNAAPADKSDDQDPYDDDSYDHDQDYTGDLDDLN
ncbi:MAG: hypothetical protein AB1782_18580 [Cyanobacteriota bacterium]